MVTTTTEYLNNVFNNVEKRFTPTFTSTDGIVLNASNIQSFEYNETSNAEESLVFGSVLIKKLKIKLYSNNPALYRNRVFTCKLTHVSGQIIPLGSFLVEDSKLENNKVELTLVDDTRKLDFPYFSELSYPNTTNNIINEIKTKTNIDIYLPPENVTIPIKLDGYTYREVLSIISGYLGKFIRTNRSGGLSFLEHKASNRTLDNKAYKKFTHAEEPIVLKQFQSNGLFSGTAGYTVKWSCPIMDQSRLDAIKTKYIDKTYYQADLELLGDPSIEAGDIITVVNKKGVSIPIWVMEHTISYNGALKSYIRSKAKPLEKQTSDNSKVNLRESIKEQTIKLALINEALINKASIVDLEAERARIDTLVANSITVENLNAYKIEVDNLIADKADISVIETNYAKITDLNAQVGRINTLESTKADITILNTQVGRIDTLESKSATVDNLFAGNITAKNLQAGLITADSGLIANGAIKDAMILDLSASKINAGTIWTNKVSIANQDGSLSLVGSLIRMWDSQNRERISLGKDNVGNFNIRIRGTDGTTIMLDEKGVHNAGITDGAINDAKVAVGANIQGSKLDIKSVIESINNDGTTTLKSSKVVFDDTGQTLSVAFNSLNNYVKNINVTNLNLVPKSHLASNFDGWSPWANKANLEIIDESLSITNKDGTLGVGLGVTSLEFTIEKDKNYRLSLDVASNGSTNLLNYCHLIYSDGQGNQRLSDISVESIIKRQSINVIPIRSGKVRLLIAKLSATTQTTEGFRFCKVKLEPGTIESEWSPAYSDYSSNFADIDEKITNLNTDLEVEQGRINTLVSEQETIKGTVNSTKSSLSTLEQDVSSFKTTIESTYETISGASGKYSTKSELSTVSQDLSGFKTSVSSTYATKTDLDNLSIGGRNYIPKSELTKSIEGWLPWGNGLYSTLTLSLECLLIQHKGALNTPAGALSPIFKVEGGKKYTLSFNAGSTYGTTILDYMYLIYQDGQGNQKLADIPLKASSPNHIRHYSNIIPVRSGEVRLLFGTVAKVNELDGVRINKVNLDLGTKPTDWTPALEDTDTQISTLNTQYSTLQSDYNGFKTTVGNTYLTKNGASGIYETKTNVSALQNDLKGFKTTVSETYETKIHAESTYGLKADVTTLQNNYSTLSQDFSGFKSTVGSTYATTDYVSKTYTLKENFTTLETTLNNFKTTVSNTYDTVTSVDNKLKSYTKSTVTSQLEQNLDNFKLSLKNTSIMNAIINGDFRNGMTYWNANYNPSIADENGQKIPIVAPGMSISQTITNLNSNAKQITLSGEIMYSNLVCPNGINITAYVWFTNGTAQRIEFKERSSVALTTNVYGRFDVISPEFTSSISKITIYIENETGNTGNFRVKNLMLCWGNVTVGYINNPGEFKTVNYIFDGYSAKFYGAGLEIYDKVGSNNKVFSVDTKGLLDLKGTIRMWNPTINEEVGQISSVSSGNEYFVNFSHRPGYGIGIDYIDKSGYIRKYLDFKKYNSDLSETEYPISLNEAMSITKPIRYLTEDTNTYMDIQSGKYVEYGMNRYYSSIRTSQELEMMSKGQMVVLNEDKNTPGVYTGIYMSTDKIILGMRKYCIEITDYGISLYRGYSHMIKPFGNIVLNPKILLQEWK